MSLLRRIGAGEDTKSIRASIPADLPDALGAFDRDAKRQGFEFPRDDIVTDALRKALAKARAELDKLAGDDADPDTDDVPTHRRRLSDAAGHVVGFVPVDCRCRRRLRPWPPAWPIAAS